MQARAYLKLSVAAAVVTIVLKSLAWWWTGSVSLAADALESLVNLAGAMFALGMITWAAQPPDAEHPYGHHKAEYFSSGFEGALILIAALGIAWAAIDRFRAPQPLEQLGVGLVLSLVSTAINGALAWKMLQAARVHRSIALEADARAVGLGFGTAPLGGQPGSNGLTLDKEGRLVLCEHGNRRVVRYEHSGDVTVVAEKFQGKRLNSPNDVVVKSDGSIWFTDPFFGILGWYEGEKAESEIKPAVWRIDGQTGQARMMTDEVEGPNGLARHTHRARIPDEWPSATYDLCEGRFR